MQTITRNLLKLSIALMLLVALFGAGTNSTVTYAASCVPNVTIDLWAKTGSATIFGTTTVPIWGYTTVMTGTATIPGPQLEVTEGDCVQVTLYNNDIHESTALHFQGQEMIPDTVGVPMGGSTSYVFAASRPGTFLYEAGLTSNGQHQVAMGLFGTLIVRPLTANQAYDDPLTAYDSEAVLVLSEMDTALNTSADPALFDMRDYQPSYFLINGKAYPDTQPITVTAGSNLLMRYVNAGMQAHSMSTLGLSQTIIAQDGSPYLYSHRMVAETIATGQTLDTISTIPASAALDTKFVVYDANMLLHNHTDTTYGGMLTFLKVGTTPPPGADTQGPIVTAIGLSPNPTDGSVDVTVSATVSDVTMGGSNVVAAEFYIDSTDTLSTTMTGAFVSPTEDVSGTIISTTLSTLASGDHTIFVRGKDAQGNWGAFRPITLVLDKTGPMTTGLGLMPNPSTGAEDVTLVATGDDTSSGGSDVVAAEYWVDAEPPIAMIIDAGLPGPIRSFSAVIPAPLSMGSHVVSVRSQDAFGFWGDVATIILQVADTLPPTTSNVIASPNPNNGFQGYNSSVPAVRVFADFSDVLSGNSNITAAEGFLDTIGTTGTGFVFIANDGSFDSPSESGYGDIPLAVIGSLSNGNHTIYVHAKDASDNWGAMSTTVLVITKSVYFSTVGNSNPPGVGGSADDADIYFWSGMAFSRVLDASSLGIPDGGGQNADVDGFDRVDATHFYMSFDGDTTLPGIGAVQDEDIVYYSAGTWSVYFDGTAAGLTANNQDIDAFSIVGSTIYFSTAGDANPPGVGGTADDADIYTWDGASFARFWDASAAGIDVSANVDGLNFVDATHFYLSFAGDTTIPVLGTVQDEDVVYFSDGTWYVFFDGTAQGLTNNNQDIDAFDIP